MVITPRLAEALNLGEKVGSGGQISDARLAVAVAGAGEEPLSTEVHPAALVFLRMILDVLQDALEDEQVVIADRAQSAARSAMEEVRMGDALAVLLGLGYGGEQLVGGELRGVCRQLRPLLQRKAGLSEA